MIQLKSLAKEKLTFSTRPPPLGSLRRPIRHSSRLGPNTGKTQSITLSKPSSQILYCFVPHLGYVVEALPNGGLVAALLEYLAGEHDADPEWGTDDHDAVASGI